MNESERRVADFLTSKGYRVLCGGWPDLLVMDKFGKVFGLEVKHAGNLITGTAPGRLSDGQKTMHSALEALGIPVHVSRGRDLDRVLAVCERVFWKPTYANRGERLRARIGRERELANFHRRSARGIVASWKKWAVGNPELAKSILAKEVKQRFTRVTRLAVRDRFTDETGEWEVIRRPSLSGDFVQVKIQRVGQPSTARVETWLARRRVSVIRNANGEESER